MKDNRSSVDFYTGPGLDEGLRILQKVKDEFDLPIVSDVHVPEQLKPAAEVLDGIEANELGFLFDDILDLGLAEVCGLRLCVGRTGSPLMDDLVDEKKLFDYRTVNSVNTHAVREICELLIGLNGNYNQTIKERIQFSDQYAEYLELRNSTEVRTHSA
ncbi:MAG: hypothetical protein ACI9FU_000928 [Granulosicoccus sp.]|jgi:hypothetical protein